MINIDYRQLQKFVNLAEIDAARFEIASLPEDKRGDYIDRNAGKWTALRQALCGIGHTKYWYSEASLQASEGHVEHFRPKSASQAYSIQGIGGEHLTEQIFD
jgi:hypothetical protein